jgi:hypothetical protein
MFVFVTSFSLSSSLSSFMSWSWSLFVSLALLDEVLEVFVLILGLSWSLVTGLGSLFFGPLVTGPLGTGLWARVFGTWSLVYVSIPTTWFLSFGLSRFLFCCLSLVFALWSAQSIPSAWSLVLGLSRSWVPVLRVLGSTYPSPSIH